MSVQEAILVGKISPGQIAGEPNLEDVTVKSTDEQQTVEAGEGYDGIGTVTVEALSLQDVTVTLSNQQQVITADSGQGYDALGSVTVPAESGGNDQLNELINKSPSSGNYAASATPDSGNSVCYGFSAGFGLTLDNGFTSINDSAFAGQGSIMSISGPGVLTVGESAFSNCASLMSVSLPSATSLGHYAFYSCGSLSSISLPSVTSAGTYAFYASGVTTVSLPSLTTLGANAFEQCTGLATAQLGVVQSLPDYAFSGCYGLSDIYLGSATVIALGSDVFAGIGDGSPRDLTVHVPSDKVSAYEADQDWAAAITAALDEDVTITFVGDYA